MLEGTTLTARHGPIAWRFDVAATGVHVNVHHWGLSRGTILRVSAGNSSLFVGGEGFLSDDLYYEKPLARNPDLVLSGQHFEALIRSLPRASLAFAAEERSYWLWNNGLRLLPALVHVLGVVAILAAMALAVRFAPRDGGIPVALALFVLLVLLEALRNRRRARPALRITFHRDKVFVARTDSAVPLAECPMGALDVRAARWSAPAMGRRTRRGILELPSVVIARALPQPLSIGGLGYWATTGGTKEAPPRYLLSPPCWAPFADALLGGNAVSAPAPTHQHPDERA